MENIDKKSNSELQSLKKELSDKFELVKLDVVKVYDYWKQIESDYYKVDKEIKNRGI